MILVGFYLFCWFYNFRRSYGGTVGILHVELKEIIVQISKILIKSFYMLHNFQNYLVILYFE